ncbi:MAG: hypothetical protein LBR15_00575 [Methanobrevibacter sp.]|nr:hypothetical protein [Candidatus Methanovirga australis]
MNRIIFEQTTNRGIAQPGNVNPVEPPPQEVAPQQNIPEGNNLYSYHH